MTHTLVLNVPESVYEPLAQTAERAGATPEQLAVEWLAAASKLAQPDPVEKFIGAFRSNTPDWADKHDAYLGATLNEQLRSGKT